MKTNNKIISCEEMWVLSIRVAQEAIDRDEQSLTREEVVEMLEDERILNLKKNSLREEESFKYFLALVRLQKAYIKNPNK